MTAFALALSPATRPALCVVAAHGLTDFGSDALVHSYALALACPMPSSVVTALFCAASVFHLADELGWTASLGMHSLVAVLDRARGHEDAFGAFLCYLAYLHTPLHYACEWRRGRRALVVVAALAGAALACACSPCAVVLSDRMQRIVIAHVGVVCFDR
tara:strand:+ start:368 stop:844 length:477 start_codon:yes stop_codon:yes gene_type:complete